MLFHTFLRRARRGAVIQVIQVVVTWRHKKKARGGGARSRAGAVLQAHGFELGAHVEIRGRRVDAFRRVHGRRADGCIAIVAFIAFRTALRIHGPVV